VRRLDSYKDLLTIESDNLCRIPSCPTDFLRGIESSEKISMGVARPEPAKEGTTLVGLWRRAIGYSFDSA